MDKKKLTRRLNFKGEVESNGLEGIGIEPEIEISASAAAFTVRDEGLICLPFGVRTLMLLLLGKKQEQEEENGSRG